MFHDFQQCVLVQGKMQAFTKLHFRCVFFFFPVKLKIIVFITSWQSSKNLRFFSDFISASFKAVWAAAPISIWFTSSRFTLFCNQFFFRIFWNFLRLPSYRSNLIIYGESFLVPHTWMVPWMHQFENFQIRLKNTGNKGYEIELCWYK